ncbi:GNAT family N-acetyltransferase [Sphingobium phenoxybenzoativorans]|uniref:GNAT family N-acetyltransferase n=1 Tax=Sphingobium phenoxybenzoativorans TaxID=1592790 RepID=UPI000871CAD2|nr:GNAT family N-acetyltransferase [Sphingobium phenoxybenzoativorans]
MTLTATFSPLPPRDQLETRWRALEARAEGSFFLGWTWMESWLSATGATPELLAVKDGAGGDAALALIGRSLDKRLLGRTPTLWLNQAGQYQADRPFIEYNGLLAARDAPADLHDVAMRAILRRNDWRALRLSGVAPDSPLLATRFRRRVRIDQSPAYHVDLDAVRAAKGDYLSLLSANTRSQIKRAAKDYGATEPAIALATETDIDGWLAEMQALNTGRHAENAWDDAVFRRFAATLTHKGLVTGEVELLRITAGDHLLGLLLNFVHRGRAMNYQSAFAAPLGPKGKPGLLCHAAAVGRYAGMDLSLYSLLAGKDRYKQSLSTGSETLEWWSLERFSPRLEAEAVLRKLLRRPVS